MSNYASEEYIESKKWISEKISEGYSWEDVKVLCTTYDKAEGVFCELRDEELIIPGDMEYEEWAPYVDEVRKGYSMISDPYGITSGTSNTLPIPTDLGSPWIQYKKYLLGQKDGKRRIN